MTSVDCDAAMCLNVNFNDGGDNEVVSLNKGNYLIIIYKLIIKIDYYYSL